MTDTPAFYDAECSQCRTAIRWSGLMADRPPCPHCGLEIDVSAMAHDLAEIAHARRAIAAIKAAKANKDRKALLAAFEMAAGPAREPA